MVCSRTGCAAIMIGGFLARAAGGGGGGGGRP